jgi:radical SAM enzyme (TIGR01210 family)
LVLGFRDQNCSYRKNDRLKLGCLNCGFYTDTEKYSGATANSVRKQLQTATQFGNESGVEYDVLEFLSDGSFLEDLSVSARDEILIEISKLNYIHRILIETRPSGVIRNKKYISKMLKEMGEEKNLEIAVGFETADEFIREVCINKGFFRDEFEESIQIISEIQNETGKKISVIAYILIKPVFLTTKESIEDSIHTIEYLNLLMEKTGINIIPKFEPSTIPEGTINLLAFQKSQDYHYNILNYWTVAEILIRAYFQFGEKEIYKNIRIGERKDMGENLFFPAVYKSKKNLEIDEIDEVLYSSIQEFNFHKDIFKILDAVKDRNLSSLYTFVNEELEGNCELIKILSK